MDFLDPKAKRRHKIRLFIGYGLMASVILVTSAILVFSAYGFDVDRKTGEVIQNGLVFVDSAPDAATVQFNDQEQRSRTNNRFSLPSGEYNLKIQKDGYRPWQRTFTLSGGGVERFTYPLLLPVNLERREIHTYDTAPTFVTQSPDRRWALVNPGGSLTDFIEYDFNSLIGPNNNNPQTRPFSLPASLFTPADGAHALELVEWSTDNKHLLVKHTFTGGAEFIVISRDTPNTSININRLLGQAPTKVTLRDKKFDQWYLYTQDGGVLQSANVNKVVTLVATGVTSYKSHDDSTLLYSTRVSGVAANQRITLKQGNNAYILRDVTDGAVMLDIARFDGAWYAVVGSDADQKTYIYKDPMNILQKADGSIAAPLAILKATGAMSDVSFSQNTRFIVTRSSQHFEVYDSQYDLIFRYDIAKVLDSGSPVSWMDGHRLSARSDGKAFIFDFDGSNQQDLFSVQPGTPLLFDRDFTVLYNTDVSTVADKYGLFGAELRLPGDK
ncbi:MAG: PEGA domain-containing protein [Candidatus Saccharimonadales bacterium]